MAADRMHPGGAGNWAAVVPLRGFATAKSRLRAQLPDEQVESLVAEVSAGVLDALLRSRSVGRILVVSDTDLSQQLPIRDRSGRVETLIQAPGGGLNEAVTEATDLLRAQDGATPLLVIHADLPYLTVTEVDHLLDSAAAAQGDAFVRDVTGTGSTALLLCPGSTRRSAFGADSATRHSGAGFVEIQLPSSSGLRQDLDTPAQYFSYQQRSPGKPPTYPDSSSPSCA